MAKRAKGKKGKTIKFEWIEPGTLSEKRKITLVGETQDDELKLISAKCFPGIICLICGPLYHQPCEKLAAR